MVKHQVNDHRESEEPNFIFKVHKSFTSSLERQIREAIRIDEEPVEALMNSKSEWGLNSIPRVTVVQDIPESTPETPIEEPTKGTNIPSEATTGTEVPNTTADRTAESKLEHQPTKKRKWNIVDHFGPSEQAQGVLIDPHADQLQPGQRYQAGDVRVRHLMEAANKCYRKVIQSRNRKGNVSDFKLSKT